MKSSKNYQWIQWMMIKNGTILLINIEYLNFTLMKIILIW